MHIPCLRGVRNLDNIVTKIQSEILATMIITDSSVWVISGHLVDATMDVKRMNWWGLWRSISRYSEK